MGKQKFDRSKPHLNVGTMGHIDHGKTTLTAAITKVQGLQGFSKARGFATIDNAPEEKERGIADRSHHEREIRRRETRRVLDVHGSHGDQTGGTDRRGRNRRRRDVP